MRVVLRRWLCVVLMIPAAILTQTVQPDRVSAQQPQTPADTSTDDAMPPAEVPAERIIYLPYKDLGEVLDQQDAAVIIPYPEYLRLWSKADGTDATGADVDAVITKAAYTVTAAGDVARIVANLTVRVVGKPWVVVPLDFGDAAVGGVSSDDGEVLLRGEGDGKYSLLLNQSGEQNIKFELTARIVTSPDGKQLEFQTPPVAVTTFELLIPDADQEVEVRPRLVQLPVEAEDGQTRIKASLGSTGQITAQWHARAGAKPQMDLLASVTNLQKVTIADELVHTDATLQYDILRGELEELKFLVPQGHRVLDVSASARVQKWQADDEDGRQVVTVQLLSPATGKLSVEVHTEARMSEGDVAVAGLTEDGAAHGVHALDVVRESGQLVITHGPELTLRVKEQSGLLRIESEQVNEAIRQPGALSYKFFSPQFALNVTAAPVEPRVTVDHQSRVEIREDQLRLGAQLVYTIERAGVFELRLTVPEGLDITRVESDQMEQYRLDDDTLVVALSQRMTGNLTLSVSGEQPLPDDGEAFDLPILEPVNVERERGAVQLFVDDSVELATSEDELEGALPDTLQDDGAQRPGQAPRMSWRFNRRPVRLPVTVTRKPTRLSAQVATDIDVQPNRTRITTTVDFLVEYSGLDTFRIDVPEAALPTLQIEAIASNPTSPALRETTLDDPAEGWVAHTLTMQRPITGRQRFRLTYDLLPTEVIPASPVAADDDAAAAAPAAEADAGDAGATDAPDADPPDADAPDADAPATDAVSSGDDPPPKADPADASTAEESDAADDAAPTTADDANIVDDAATDATDESTAAAADGVPRLQTRIRILRPRAPPVEDDADETALRHVTGEVRLGKEESLTITADATGGDIEPIDVRELTLLPTQGTLAFRYHQHKADKTIALDVTQARFDVQEMIATVISRAVVEVMLGDDQTATCRCRYRIKSTQRQRLEIRLPSGVQLLSVLVNDADVRLEPVEVGVDENWDTYNVNVSRSGESDEPFHLSLQYLLTFNGPPFDAGFLRGRIEVPLPLIGARDGSAATQQLRMIAWVPEEYALIGDPSGFVLEGKTSLLPALLGAAKPRYRGYNDDDWVGCAVVDGLDFATAGRVEYRYTNMGGQGTIKLLWWNIWWVTLVVTLAMAIMALLLVRTDWENKLGILLLILLGAALLGLKNMHVLAHGLSVMRFGLLFMIGLWVIHELLHLRPTTTIPTDSPTSSGVTAAIPPYVAAVPPPGVFDEFLPPSSEDNDDSKK